MEKRYESILKGLSDQEKCAPHLWDYDLTDHPQETYSEDPLDDYIDVIIKKYRFERTKRLKFTREDIERQLYFYDKSPYRSYESMEETVKMIKYYAFFEKYKKIYIPTNMEVERIIVINY